ncbi:hypothetical protein OROGR_006588 [Orobanche gracilis]
MWALRRASVHLRNRGVSLGTGQIFYAKSDKVTCLENYNAGVLEPQAKILHGLLTSTRLFNTSSVSPKSHREVHTFSSQAGAKSTKEDDDDLEDGFSELETPPGMPEAAIFEDDSDDDLSKSELFEDEGIAEDIQNDLEAFGVESDVGENSSTKTRASSAMAKAILGSHALPVSKVLDKWVGQGNEVNQTEATLTMIQLRKRKMFGKALELSEWLESKGCFEFVESNYASRVDLIAKVRGNYKAEAYIKLIPESCRGELVYRTLLANCVSTTNAKKSEEIFNKMKDLKFPLTCFSCNQLLLLYKRTDKRKIADVLELMEKEDIKPSVFTYQVLIDVKGQSNDITGMEEVVERMKAEGIKHSSQIKVSLARYYAYNRLEDKAEAVLKEIEGGNINKNRWVCQWLIPIYASLGREDEVERLWKVCENDPRLLECMSAIDAWGQLKKIEKAEVAFDKLMAKVKKPSSKHFTSLLKVYVNHKMFAKGKELVRRMGESGCTLGPLTWDAIVKLYVGAGEVEKADSVLMKAVKQKKGRPLFSSYLSVMEEYASRGDVHNSEKTLLMTRQAGYFSRLKQYQTLLDAYANAKVPVYGFSERMKADNVFPNKVMAAQLAKVDPFRKSAVSELLE